MTKKQRITKEDKEHYERYGYYFDVEKVKCELGSAGAGWCEVNDGGDFLADSFNTYNVSIDSVDIEDITGFPSTTIEFKGKAFCKMDECNLTCSKDTPKTLPSIESLEKTRLKTCNDVLNE